MAGIAFEFSDCREVGQGGPLTCEMSIDGKLVVGGFLWARRSLRFHPSPLEFDGDILAPLREATRFYLARIDPRTLKVGRLSRGYAFMRLRRVSGVEVEFSTWWDDREIRTVRLA